MHAATRQRLRLSGGTAHVPPEVAARIPAESWEEDWRVMQSPGPAAST